MDKKKKRYNLNDFVTLSEKQILILEAQNITTIESLAGVSTLELKTILDTTPNKAATILKEARDNLPPFKIYKANMLLEFEKSKEKIPLGCKALDSLLGGGIETGSITEFYAQYGSGKSQISFTAIVRAMLKKPHGLDGSVVIIDTEGTFSPTRIMQIRSYYSPEELDMTDQEFLENIHVIQPLKSSEQLNILREFVQDECLGYLNYIDVKKPLKLLVVDSLTNLFRCEYVGRGTLAERQQKLNEHIRDLYIFAVKNQVAVLVTNQVISNPDPFSPQTELAVGGNVIAHGTTYRISIRKRRDYRIATMVDSSKLPSGQAIFRIAPRGVVDLEEE